MKVQKIQNNNYSSTSFRANLNIRGPKINEYAEAELKEISRKIGTAKDKIEIELSEVNYTENPFLELVGVSPKGKIANRYINATSDINGTVENKDLSFSRAMDFFSPEHTTIMRIRNYLQDLLRKTENSVKIS